jgi:hypothetical protein
MWSAITRSDLFSRSCGAGELRRRADQGLEQVDLVVAVHVLQHRGERSRPMPVSTQGAGSGTRVPSGWRSNCMNTLFQISM